VKALLGLLLLGFVQTGCGGAQATLGVRAIYTDLDGTSLLSRDRQPNPATAAALREFQRRGGKLGIATGRTPQQLSLVLATGTGPGQERRLSPDLPLVLFNGAVVLSPDLKTTLAVQSLDPAVVPKVEAVLSEPGRGVRAVMTHFLRQTFVSSKATLLQVFSPSSVRDAREEPSLSAVMKSAGSDDPLIKVVVVVEPERAKALEAALSAVLGSSARAVLSEPQTACVEVLSHGSNKASGIRTALGGTGIRPEDLLVFGDSSNDQEMLREFPHSVAMGNCSGSACEAATARLCRACTVDTDAIERVIHRYVFGQDSLPDPFALTPCDCRQQVPSRAP
jgi:Cof subfamily protein (haloacid dehalogenase superfamily)